ncbi:hypothetical protein TVAG_228290 [Trichomonas vaginalis G3]|uniref:DUF4200 domain-containing protein n=1 Tax=Trichomonas vaginalis (strain ATCC PRA-98 / G3) TaxID=412133 RepID=A2DIZ1_TRIV3|nr:cilia- and flagella-associated protein 100 family [Trichomonas vaginalis G3]EAY19566.1 hypothetical protein TVAG_228290 [Trichomonas vaginalis G3]KAI5515895.1 cilia- and flagella-associated protein 100 family [Trichomonas vaginalis G3]|eukprot:XP_001580552.1 hypothetical protein [Trichomonas vaginalis G3]
MDELEMILRLTDISADGEAVEYNRSGNPFITVSRDTKTETRERRNNRLTREQLEKSQQTLEERSELCRRRVPCLTTPATTAHQSRVASRARSPANELDNTYDVSQHRGRTKTMNEKMYQTRQIYLTQLLINKKQADIQRLQRIQNNTEYNTRKAEQDVSDEANELKNSMNVLQAALSKSRKIAAENEVQYSTLKKELLQLQANFNAKSSIISKNEEILEQYQEYEKFLKLFVPETVDDIFSYFHHPSVLIEEMELLQDETLSLVKCYSHYMQAQNAINEKTQKKAEQQDIEEQLIEASEVRTKLAPLEDYTPRAAAKQNNSLDQELNRLTNLISDTYKMCFGNAPSMSPIAMLEKIETNLENMMKIEETVSSEILLEIKTKKDEERKLKERLDGQEKRRLEQLRKYEQALQRANKAIPRHDKRFPKERMLPGTRVQKVDTKSERLAALRKKEDELLYGPSD